MEADTQKQVAKIEADSRDREAQSRERIAYMQACRDIYLARAASSRDTSLPALGPAPSALEFAAAAMGLIGNNSVDGDAVGSADSNTTE